MTMRAHLIIPLISAACLLAMPLSAQQSKDGLIDLDRFSRQRFHEVDGKPMTEGQKREYEAEVRRRSSEESIAMGDRLGPNPLDKSPLMGNPTIPPPR